MQTGMVGSFALCKWSQSEKGENTFSTGQEMSSEKSYSSSSHKAGGQAVFLLQWNSESHREGLASTLQCDKYHNGESPRSY